MDSQSKNNRETEVVYKTKIIQFLGRSVPIILQNDNGPCPLLAICNVLLLRNNLSLSLDTNEIASSRLLDLVAERLIDSNSNIGNKDDEYANNQRQNISDAITLLPSLATGLDVNVRFRNIHDFEFTRECTVFDLLDISLVHGWLCDPQDEATSKIIGDKSYNSLAERLVELQTAESDLDLASTDHVEFPATTAESLRATSPLCEVPLKTNVSSELETYDTAGAKPKRKGDIEEEIQLLQAMNISLVDNFHTEVDSSSHKTNNAHNDSIIQNHENVVPPFQDQQFVAENDKKESYPTSSNNKESLLQIGTETGQLHHDNGGEVIIIQQNDGNHVREDSNSMVRNELQSVCIDGSEILPEKKTELLDVMRTEIHQDTTAEPLELRRGHDSGHAIANQLSLSLHDTGAPLNSSYEGEFEVRTSEIENKKPLYEGESSTTGSSQQIRLEEEGVIIHNFLQGHASQLTIYGLFCLQDGLKERELCVFFRNNHFNTMFKYNGQLYLLVTDQGYLNESDIVWEKLDEVHGDTVLMTGAFLPFQGAEGNGLWDEQRVIAATEEFLSSQKDSSVANVGAHLNNMDLQLAMSLQHQEFEQQKQTRSTTSSTPGRPQSQSAHGRPDGSKLITGPKKSSYSSSKPDPKSKCAVM